MTELDISVNGQSRRLPSGSSIRDLLTALALPAAVAVERNGELVPASDHADTVLIDGDRLEIVTFVGGG